MLQDNAVKAKSSAELGTLVLPATEALPAPEPDRGDARQDRRGMPLSSLGRAQIEAIIHGNNRAANHQFFGNLQSSQVIDLLGSNTFRIREDAHTFLLQQGEGIRDALMLGRKQAIANGDAEQQQRVEMILRAMDSRVASEFIRGLASNNPFTRIVSTAQLAAFVSSTSPGDGRITALINQLSSGNLDPSVRAALPRLIGELYQHGISHNNRALREFAGILLRQYGDRSNQLAMLQEAYPPQDGRTNPALQPIINAMVQDLLPGLRSNDNGIQTQTRGELLQFGPLAGPALRAAIALEKPTSPFRQTLLQMLDLVESEWSRDGRDPRLNPARMNIRPNR